MLKALQLSTLKIAGGIELSVKIHSLMIFTQQNVKRHYTSKFVTVF